MVTEISRYLVKKINFFPVFASGLCVFFSAWSSCLQFCLDLVFLPTWAWMPATGKSWGPLKFFSEQLLTLAMSMALLIPCYTQKLSKTFTPQKHLAFQPSLPSFWYAYFSPTGIIWLRWPQVVHLPLTIFNHCHVTASLLQKSSELKEQKEVLCIRFKGTSRQVKTVTILWE